MKSFYQIRYSTLEDLYGFLRRESSGSDIILKMGENHTKRVRDAIGKTANTDPDHKQYIELINKISKRCMDYLSDLYHSSKFTHNCL